VYSVPVHYMLFSAAAGAYRNDAGALFISVERRALYDMQSADRLHCDLYTVYVCLSARISPELLTQSRFTCYPCYCVTYGRRRSGQRCDDIHWLVPSCRILILLQCIGYSAVVRI